MTTQTVTSRHVREGYQREVSWTYQEAAEWSGLSASRVRHMASETLGGKSLFKRANAIGPYKVDARSFMQYIKTGKAHG